MESALRTIKNHTPRSLLLVTRFWEVISPNHVRPKSLFSYLALFSLTILFGCAPLVPYPPTPPFAQKEVDRLIARLTTQGDEVTSFQGFGQVRFKYGEEVSETSLLAVGGRPLRVRLEISHPWGRPLFFVVAEERHTQAVSFVEKKIFMGELSQLPVGPFSVLMPDLEFIWKVLSGSVPILPHSRAASLKQHEIRLLDAKEEIREIITFSPGSRLPRSVHFPDKGITVVLSNYERGDWGMKPLRLVITSQAHNRSAEIRYKRLLINRSVPEEIFRLVPPPGFEIVDLNPQES